MRNLTLRTILLAANVLLAGLWFVAPPFSTGSTAVAQGPHYERSRVVSPPSPNAELAAMRQRLTARIEAECLARLARTESHADPIMGRFMWIVRDGTLDRVATDYADLLHSLALPQENKSELKALLARRESSTTYHAVLPADVAATGVPTTYVIDREYWDNCIRERFGIELSATIAAYASDIPLRKETAELATALAVAQQELSADRSQALQDLLRQFPAPTKSDTESKADFAARRVQRIEQLAAATDTQLGESAAVALVDYLLDDEERRTDTGAAVERMRDLRRARASGETSTPR